MLPRLYYAHDPMCSWCYGFDQTRRALFDELHGIVEINRLLGGLAPDSDAPMPPETRTYVQQAWHKIEARIPGTRFNFDFWKACEPRRSTYPACRAVIAARHFGDQFDPLMTSTIQRAYYTEARNPSNDSTLIELAVEIGLDGKEFTALLNSAETVRALNHEITRSRALGLDSFPSLLLEMNEMSRWPIPIDYNHSQPMKDLIIQLVDVA